MADSVIPDEVKVDAVKTKGYFIYPSQLFANVAATANTNESLNTDLAAIFKAIENSASGYPSEADIRGLFSDFDTTSNRLGNTVKEKNARLAKVLKGVERLPLRFEDNQGDLFGDAYEFLISNYAANAGKSGGEFFTPQHVSKLIAQLAMHGQTSVNKIYDPAAGSGSLLLQAKKHFDDHIIEDGFFGQEINYTTYNLARMNMFLHNINYDKFNIQNGNTLENPHFLDERPFDAIVSNPPYSVRWKGDEDPTLINDERFAPAGVLAPKSKADFAFVLHALHYLSAKGRAAIVCFPGIFHRGGAEQKIRKHLVDSNVVEAVIALAPNLFFGTTIAVNILVLAKNKIDTKVQFIDATGEDFFDKKANTNEMSDAHVAHIIDLFASKKSLPHVAETVDQQRIIDADYDLSVSTYVEPKDTRKTTDIHELNAKLQTRVSNIHRLRSEIDAINKQMEGVSGLALFESLSGGAKVEWLPLGKVTTYEQPTKYLVESTKYDSQFEIPVLTAGKTFILGYTDEDFGIYRASVNPTIIFDDFTTANKWVDFDFKAKSSAMKMITSSDDNRFDLKYVYYWLSTLPSGLVDGDHKRQWLSKYVNKELPVPCPNEPKKSLTIQREVVRILDSFTKMAAELEGEIAARQKQYEYYRDILLRIPRPTEAH